jgi:Ca-activated chloride channel homolog
MPHHVGSAVLALIAVAVQAAGPQQPPVFRSGVETVAVYATVLDRGGGTIVNLNRGDFAVYDDGRRQNLTVFVAGQQPITAAVLVDTSASMTLNLDQARSAAEQFVIRMLPGDTARVGSFSDRVDLSPGFTGDRDVLLRSLREGLHIGNPTLLWDAVDQTMSALAPLGGRRIILVLTDGVDTISKTTGEALLERARLDELMLYIVQFSSSPRALLAEEPLSPSASALFSSNRPALRPAPTTLLRRLAQQTGGGHFILGRFDDVNATFTQVMQELHHQYTLGFTPERADGRLHSIQVRVNRPGATVRARQTYQAAKGP